MKTRFAPVALMLSACAAMLPLSGMADEWPSKPIRMIVPANAGGGTANPVSRHVADELTRLLNQKLVVENRRMLEAEKTRFQAGESNVFILNQREVNLINAEVKVVELQLQQHLNVLQQYHLSGLMQRYALQP